MTRCHVHNGVMHQKHAHKRLLPIPRMSVSTQPSSRTCSLRIGHLHTRPSIITAEPALPQGALHQHTALRAWQCCSQSSWMSTLQGYKHLQRAGAMQLLTFRSCGASSCSISAAFPSRICHWSGKEEADIFTEHDWAINPCRSTIHVDQSGMLRRVMQVHPVAKQQDGGQILTGFPDVFNKLVTRRRCCRCCSQTLPSRCVVKHTHNHTVDDQDSPCFMLLRLTSCSSPPAGAATASSRTRCLPPCCARWASTCTPRLHGCTPLARSRHIPMRSGHMERACPTHAEWRKDVGDMRKCAHASGPLNVRCACRNAGAAQRL
jgi:hypothetical protein